MHQAPFRACNKQVLYLSLSIPHLPEYQYCRCFDIIMYIPEQAHLAPYSPTLLQNVLSLVLQIFLFLAAFECNTTSDWLNHTV